jgi:hypothetical protein
MLKTRKVKTRKPAEGFALMITLVAMLIIAIVAFGLLAVTNSYTRGTVMFNKSQKAYYAARAGISHSIDLIEQELVKSKPNYLISRTVSKNLGEEGSFRAVIDYHRDNSKVSHERKLWRIESTGSYDNADRRLVAWVERETLAAFSYITDREADSFTFWWVTGQYTEGRVHTNGYFSFNGNPQFLGKVTSAQQGDGFWNPNTRLYKGSIYDPSLFYHSWNSSSGPVGATEDFMFVGGSPIIPLPQSMSDITGAGIPGEYSHYNYVPSVPIEDILEVRLEFFADGSIVISEIVRVPHDENQRGTSLAAYEAMSPEGKRQENQLNADYIRANPGSTGVPGDPPDPNFYKLQLTEPLREMAMIAPEETRSPVEPSMLLTYKHDYSSRTNVVKGPGIPPDKPSGWPGSLWAKDSPRISTNKLIVTTSVPVRIMGGTLNGKCTVISEEPIKIVDSVRYRDRTKDVLGIISKDNIIIDTPYTAKGDIYIDGCLLSIEGGLHTRQYDLGSPRGMLEIFGTVALKHPGTVGRLTNSGAHVSGYKARFLQDPKLLYHPPLMFPGTNKCSVVYIEDLGALGR